MTSHWYLSRQAYNRRTEGSASGSRSVCSGIADGLEFFGGVILGPLAGFLHEVKGAFTAVKVHDKINITLTLSGVGIGKSMELLREYLKALGKECHLSGMD